MYKTFQLDRFNMFAPQALYLSKPRHTRKVSVVQVKCFHRDAMRKP